MSDDDFRNFDPVLLKKVARIFADSDEVLRHTLNHARELALKQIREVFETPQLTALVKEYSLAAVLQAVDDVQCIRLKALEELFGEKREKPTHAELEQLKDKLMRKHAIESATDVERDPKRRLN